MKHDNQFVEWLVILEGDSRLHTNGKGLYSDWLGHCLFLTLLSVTIGAYGQNVNVYSSPRFYNLDASIFRTVKLTERLDFEFRSEWLHATNTPQFSLPNTQFGSSSFGLVTGVAGGNRIINVAGKVVF
jgi:hypothetical protein